MDMLDIPFIMLISSGGIMPAATAQHTSLAASYGAIQLINRGFKIRVDDMAGNI
jgi:hypothetical protein